jgi:hypothetical protein
MDRIAEKIRDRIVPLLREAKSEIKAEAADETERGQLFVDAVFAVVCMVADEHDPDA